MQNECNRLTWFKRHVGRTIFRTHNGCECRGCGIIYAEGQIVRNQVHARYLYDMELVDDLMYFGTKLERDEYVLGAAVVAAPSLRTTSIS